VRAVVAFALFCGLSGAVYLLNDVADRERDRMHPLKRLRPVASGALSPRTAVGLAALIGFGCLALSFTLGVPFAACTVLYLGLNLLYSFSLKEVVILDVLAISMGFVLRAVAGAVAIGVLISDWLLICTILLALFLTLSKRRHELTSLSDTAVSHRPTLQEYSPYLLDQMIAVVTGLLRDLVRLLHHRPGDPGQVPDRSAGLDAAFRAVRDLPLSLPRAPQGAGRQPHRRPPDRPAAARGRGPVGPDRGRHPLHRQGAARAPAALSAA
jgi:hypothetical protein